MSDTSPHILIVDDHSPTRTLIRLGLQRLGYKHFHEAADGREAVEILPQQQIGVVLTDLEMDGMGGMDLLRYVRANHGDLPVIILTSHHDQDFRDSANELGASGFLPKPLNLKDLQTIMEQVLTTA